jgi:integral membrane sensor domain MASE1
MGAMVVVAACVLAPVLAITVGVFVLNALGFLVAHFVLGYSVAYIRRNFFDLFLFGLMITAPLLLLSGMIGKALRDEYDRVLQMRMRKW